MDVITLRQQIMNRAVDNFYVFNGTEITVMNLYVEQIGKFMNKTVKYIDKVSEIYGKTTKSLLTPLSYCYVCIDDTDFMESKKAWENIESVIGDNILITWYNKLDKRSAFYKHYDDVLTDRVVTFNKISDEWLITYIQRQIDLSERNCRTLIDICDHSYDRILLEIDKIKRYANGI